MPCRTLLHVHSIPFTQLLIYVLYALLLKTITVSLFGRMGTSIAGVFVYLWWVKLDILCGMIIVYLHTYQFHFLKCGIHLFSDDFRKLKRDFNFLIRFGFLFPLKRVFNNRLYCHHTANKLSFVRASMLK